MLLPNNFYRRFNGSQMAAIRRLMSTSNNYLSGSNISNSSFFFIEVLHRDELK